ncbi:MAG: hypothetical protein ABFE13_11395 [Phycisphaerales bacterium]
MSKLPPLRDLITIAGVLVSIGMLVQSQKMQDERLTAVAATVHEIGDTVDKMQEREVELAKWQAVHEAEEKSQDRRLDGLEAQGITNESNRQDQNRRIGKMEGR